MAISLYAALVILEDWCSEERSVRFSFIGRDIKVSYSHGAILDVAENEFKFGSKDVTATVDIGLLSNADFILVDEFKSVLPPEIVECLEGEEECALLFKGVSGELAVILA